jgi:hypothetical protein
MITEAGEREVDEVDTAAGQLAPAYDSARCILSLPAR